MPIIDKMNPAFAKANGGLFAKTSKADVGGGYLDMQKQGIDLLGWADPFMPDYFLPEEIKNAWLKAVQNPAGAHYTAPSGSDELKRKLARKLKEKNHLDVDPQRNIIITPFLKM